MNSNNCYDRAKIRFIQQKIQRDKKYLLSILNFDKQLYRRIEDLFNIDLNSVPDGKEPLYISKAVFKINNAELAIKKIEQHNDINLTAKKKDVVDYMWSRAYPEGHWSPLSNMPGARQILGDIRINFDNTLTVETKTKSWMIKLILYMRKILGKEVKLINLEFQNPLDLLSNNFDKK